jgi:hypothetical protein
MNTRLAPICNRCQNGRKNGTDCNRAERELDEVKSAPAASKESHREEFTRNVVENLEHKLLKAPLGGFGGETKGNEE